MDGCDITDIDVVRNITKVWGATGFNYLGENMMVLDIDEGRIRNKNLHHKGVPSHELLHGLGLNHSPNPKSLIHESGTGKLLFEDSKALLNSSLFNKEYKTTLKKVERIEKK